MVADFLADLSRLGVQVWADNGQLRYRAPARTLTDDLRAEIVRHKTALLALLQERERTTVLEHAPLLIPDPERRHEPFPLTDIQQAYWIGRGSGFELGGVGTHAYFEFERTDVDVERLTDAWQTLIVRHGMLRAVVRPDGQQQVLAAVPPYRIEVTDLRTRPEADALAEAEALRERIAHQVYDPARWPLFEIRATQLPGGRTRLHVSIDLLIADVWSLFLLFREWGALYADPTTRLPPLTLSFRDYVLADAARRATPPYAQAQAYWAARLPALRPGPDLPLACAPAAITQPRFVRRSGRLDADRWQAIKRRARQQGLTPSMVLCAVFAEVLAAWSKEPQFTLTVTLFHRLPLHPEVDAVVGDFTSTVLLAVDAPGDADLTGRANLLQQQLWADLEHREVSGVRVLRDLARQSGGGPRAAMPVVFTSTLGHEVADTKTATSWLGRLVSGISQTPQVWLDHQTGEDGAALVFNWDAVEALFPGGLLDAMFAAYGARLTRLGADDSAWTMPPPWAAGAPGAASATGTGASAVDLAAPVSRAVAPPVRKTFIPPRDDLERQIAAIWEDVLGVRPVGVTDHFFDLGGNSFLAARLLIRVQQQLGHQLPVSTLLHAGDVESLARIVAGRGEASPVPTIVRLATGGARPFFCVHPIGGNVMCYVDLARCLGGARDFYGIQAPGLQGGAAPFTDVHAMAAHYLEQIRAVQPQGPYLLGGWSMGGTVAFEIARQLAAQGEATQQLVLIDTETSTVAASDCSAVRQPHPAYEIPAGADPAQLERLYAVFTSHDRALAAYRERPYAGPLTLIRAHEQPDGRGDDLGWNEFAVGGLRIRGVPGNHYTMLQRPNVDALAAELRQCLEAAVL
jgi:thioesterase domain-containing protein